ncbi:sensor histidine kinase N-terminal domain-containing protein [Erwinia pyri]|uniref:histidine kinase n=1 Tax=Erwinia pyri TaxID=3062598 RepID=A0AA50HRK6_9GAMM|nr:sensor histidine kinase N-terminal domain-containing protein [Erwinia sp. DE2]WLS80135.1 sensor histidine kinase N-terminal domain-containing protein [Erwinia sp. DE2]
MPAIKPVSLRRQLLLWLGLPLILLWGLSVYTHYASALQAATQAYDRSLLASARTVAERLRVKNNRLEVDVPWVVLDSFERNMNDQLFYQVISPEGKTLSGYDDIPPLPANVPRSVNYPALVHFYDATYRQQPIRVAALWQPVSEENLHGMALILVAETLTSREEFAGKLLKTVLLSQGALVLMTLLLAAGMLKKVLRPLRRLSGLMARRDPGDLTPLPAVLPWAEMQPLMLSVNRYIERLRQMMARQQRFSADASHQLRTPLTILKTQVAVALKSDRPESWKESLQAMRVTLDETIALTNRLLQLSRLRAHQTTDMPLQAVDLAALAKEACFSHFAQARAKQIDLGYEGEEGFLVRGDALLIGELCANLIDNAIKYTPPEGTVTVSVRDGTLTVEDSGKGIAAAQRQQAMLPFNRLSEMGAAGGAGLGLALVKDIADWHGTHAELHTSPALGGLLVRLAFTQWDRSPPPLPASAAEEFAGAAPEKRPAE